MEKEYLILDQTGNPLVEFVPEAMPLALPKTDGPPHPLTLIQDAMKQGMPPDQLRQFFELQERWERAEAAKTFALALTNFQAECPPVFKSRVATVKTKDGGGSWSYKFVGYDDIKREAGPVMAKHGIVTTFSSDTVGDKAIKVTCRVRVGTHVEETVLTVPIPNQMVVNDTQKYGAALSYAKRYAFCAALDLVISDEDDDAVSLMDTITAEQVRVLESMIEKKAVEKRRFLEWIAKQCKIDEVKSVADMPSDTFDKAIALLKQKKDKPVASE